MEGGPTLRKAPFLWTLAVAVGLLFAVFVWPTPYGYDHLGGLNGVSVPVRINRFTGRAEMMRGDGWVRMEPK